MVLNIERESGLYLTTEKAIRKAFNKSTRAGSLSRVRDALDPSRTRDSEKQSGKLSSNASYFTAKLSDVEELVRFWHINLGPCPSKK